MSSSKCVLARILQIPFTTHRSRGTSENACNFEVRTSVIVKVMGTADELGVVTRTCEGNTKFPGENTQNKQVSFPPPPAATFMDSLKFAHGAQTRTTKWVPSNLSKGKKQNREKCQQGSGVPSPSEPRPCCPPLCDAGQAAGLSVPQFARFPGRSCWRPVPTGSLGCSQTRQPAPAARLGCACAQWRSAEPAFLRSPSPSVWKPCLWRSLGLEVSSHVGSQARDGAHKERACPGSARDPRLLSQSHFQEPVFSCLRPAGRSAGNALSSVSTRPGVPLPAGPDAASFQKGWRGH